MRAVAALALFAASALAYQVTEPTPATGWTISGPNEVAWNFVSTDRANFTIALVNQVNNPPSRQVLNALVDATLNKIVVNPPSGGWKAGEGFQVNLVQDAQNLDTILAQSEKFAILTAKPGTSPTSSVNQITPPVISSVNQATNTNSGSSTLPSDLGLQPKPNSAAAASNLHSAFFAGIAMVGALFV